MRSAARRGRRVRRQAGRRRRAGHAPALRRDHARLPLHARRGGQGPPGDRRDLRGAAGGVDAPGRLRMRRAIFTDGHDDFRWTIRRFIEREVVPAYPEWVANRLVPRDLFRRLGEIGVLGMNIPVEYGGARAPGHPPTRRRPPGAPPPPPPPGPPPLPPP